MTASEMMAAEVRLLLDSFPENSAWWCPYCGTTECSHDDRCTQCGTPIADCQPDTTRIDALRNAITAYETEPDDLTAAYMSGFEKSREVLDDRIRKMIDAQILLNEIANGKTVTTGEAQAYFHRHYGKAVIEHPDDRLSREAGLALNAEIEGKYTRVVTERLFRILPCTCGDCRLTQTCEVPIVTQNEVGDFTGRTVTTDREACRAHHIAYLTQSDDLEKHVDGMGKVYRALHEEDDHEN